MTYYSNVNPDLLSRTPVSARRVLEIGCGTGGFARAYLAANPMAEYWGVELLEDAAAEACPDMHAVVVGNIEQAETMAELDARRDGALFDVLIFGDVLEHLHDPWRILSELRQRMAPGASCCICIPNVAHWSLLHQQLKGRWDYADAGLLDRTHLRFFTRSSAIDLLHSAGWTLVDANPRVLWPDKTDAALKILTPAAEALGATADQVRADLSAFQWILRAVNGPLPRTTTVAGLGLPKVAGVTEARIDHPIAALSSMPEIRATWGSETLSIPRKWPPGVLTIHRRFLNRDALAGTVEMMIGKGWVVVSDIDDDPHHWASYVDSDFAAFRNVHAVSVSTRSLAEMVRAWNPNVVVLPNAVSRLPQISSSTPKSGDRLRVFFGALNRGGDWVEMIAAIGEAAARASSPMELVVVHDRAFFDALPSGVAKTFHPTVPHDRYMALLAECDIALLPLADTPFNRLKSDLKMIECCAAGAVPICSPVIYADGEGHDAFAVFATSPASWRDALTSLVDDPADLRRRRVAGLAHVSERRMQSQQVPVREAWYRSLVADQAKLEADRRDRMSARRSAES